MKHLGKDPIFHLFYCFYLTSNFVFPPRIEYDAYRSDLEVILQSALSGSSSALSEAQQAHDLHKAEFEKLRADLSVKLRFLNENRVKVRLIIFNIFELDLTEDMSLD